MINKIKGEVLNFGLKFLSVDEKIVRMLLETSPSNVSEIVILPAVRNVMNKVVKNLQNKIRHGRVYNGILNGVRVSVILSNIGCPNVAMILECLKRCKTSVIVRVDLCGAIPKEGEITVGDVLIPKLVYCDDGTSPQYIRSHRSLQESVGSIKNPLYTTQDIVFGNQVVSHSKPDEKLKEILLNTGHSLPHCNIMDVDFWTTDALFCETVEFVQALQSINVRGIDMESSILFLLGSLFNLKTASVLSVTDLPGHPEYDLLSSNKIHPNMENGIDNAIKIVINALPKIKTLIN